MNSIQDCSFKWNQLNKKGTQILENLFIDLTALSHDDLDSQGTKYKDEVSLAQRGAGIQLMDLMKELRLILDSMYTTYTQIINYMDQNLIKNLEKEQELKQEEMKEIDQITTYLSMFEKEYKLKETIVKSIILDGSPTREQISTVLVSLWRTQPYIDEKFEWEL
ncbi:hypothetical protein G9A89_005463 [Geosiphon pyriformis]|nr:hypothetical protein G9A89_005463 [Geosiphon pyriformis]